MRYVFLNIFLSNSLSALSSLWLYVFLDLVMQVITILCHFNPYNAEIILYKPWRPNVFFKFKFIINVSSFRFI